MAKLKDITSFISSRIGSKTAPLSLSPTDEQESFEKIINDLQSDLRITDKEDARYVWGQENLSGISKYKTYELPDWEFGKSYKRSLDSLNYTFEFSKMYGIVRRQIDFTGVTYEVGSRININATNEAGNGDIGGVQLKITPSDIHIIPKNFVIGDIGGGFQTISSYKGTGNIKLVVELYGVKK